MLEKIKIGGLIINITPEKFLKEIVNNEDSDEIFYLISKKQLKEIYKELTKIIELTQ